MENMSHSSEQNCLSVHLKDSFPYYVEVSGFQRCYMWARQISALSL